MLIGKNLFPYDPVQNEIFQPTCLQHSSYKNLWLQVRLPLLVHLFSCIISVTVPENLDYFIARCAENIHENWCLEKVRLSWNTIRCNVPSAHVCYDIHYKYCCIFLITFFFFSFPRAGHLGKRYAILPRATLCWNHTNLSLKRSAMWFGCCFKCFHWFFL